jgi:hypothetical protein
MLIRNHHVRVPPPAPEFGKKGSWPPIATDWLTLRWELFRAATTEITAFMAARVAMLEGNDSPLLTEDAMRTDFLHEAVFSQSSTVYNDSEFQFNTPRGAVAFNRPPWERASPNWLFRGQGEISFPDKFEIRRLVHAARWKREDPVIQLPPGATHERTHSITKGLSVEHSRKLAESLGMSAGVETAGLQAKLSSQLDQEFGFKLDISALEESGAKLTLTNQSNDHYKLFALWHMEHQITIDTLTMPVYAKLKKGSLPTWEPQSGVEFTAANQPFVTFAEIERIVS